MVKSLRCPKNGKYNLETNIVLIRLIYKIYQSVTRRWAPPVASEISFSAVSHRTGVPGVRNISSTLVGLSGSHRGTRAERPKANILLPLFVRESLDIPA